mgnify:FL=1
MAAEVLELAGDAAKENKAMLSLVTLASLFSMMTEKLPKVQKAASSKMAKSPKKIQPPKIKKTTKE